MSDNKKKLQDYIIKFSINLLYNSEIITKYIDLPATYNNPELAWNYITNQFKTITEGKTKIKKDILRLICHDNFKKITTNIKGNDIRYLIAQKIIDECYIFL